MNKDKKRSGGPMGGMGVPEKPKDMMKAFKTLVKELSNYKVSIILVLIFAIVGTILSIVGPKILGNATTELYNGIVNKISNQGGINFDKIKEILLFVLGLYVLSAILNYIQGYIMTNVSQKYTYYLRDKVSKKLNKIPVSYFDKRSVGDVLSVITNDIDTISINLNQSATQFITSIITIIGILVMMFSINAVMTLVALLVLPLSTFIIVLIVKKSQKHFKHNQEYLGDVNGEIEEMISNQEIVKVFNAEDKILKKFNEDNNKLYESGWKSQFFSGLLMPIMSFVNNLGYVGVAILGGFYAINGKITIGDIQSFLQYMKQFTQPISQISQIFNMLQSMAAASERVFEFLDAPEEKDAVKSKFILDEMIGQVDFDHVKFGYDQDKIIVKDFSATVKQGQKIAIVGPTGAGKTTIVKLLMRFYDVLDGKIMIDGVNIADYDRHKLRQAFGMVLQDAWLFSGTIMENLKYGKLTATDEEVINATKLARVHHFIQTLPDKYNMELNEDVTNISSGQKQLLTIARVILADPKVLILDEATSNVDTRTEVLIQEAMDNLMKGRTTFVIAHRLSTIKNADLILVMNEGDIIETGTHQELLSKHGFYANLYNSQFEEETT